ncbi:MAG: hypothetical protein AAF790_01515 [Planctomycetota bacterium]
MSTPEADSKADQNGRTMVRVVAVALVAGWWFLLSWTARLSEGDFERQQAERRQAHFNQVKQGEDTAEIVMDAELLPLLAGDADCIANLKYLHFQMVGVAPEQAELVSRFSNLKEIHFYDTNGADLVLRSAHGLPVESLSFMSTYLPVGALQGLPNFANLKTVRFETAVRPEQLEVLESLPDRITVEIPYPATPQEPGGDSKPAA